MGYPLKQAQTAQALVFLMVDSTDHLSPKTGLAPTVTLSKNGATFGSPAGAVTEVGSGWYKVAGHATDSGTLGPLVLHATATGADPTDDRYDVVGYDPQDVVRLGLTALPNVAAGAAGGLLTDKVGYALTAAYDLAKTAAQVSDIPTAAATATATATQITTDHGAGSYIRNTEPPSTAAQATATAAQITTDHGAGSYARNTEPDNAGIAAIKAKTDNLPSAPAAVSDIPTAAATATATATQITTDHGAGSYIRNTEPPSTAAQATATAAQITTDHGAGSYARNTEPDNRGIPAFPAKTASDPSAPAAVSDIPSAAATATATAAQITTDHGAGSYIRNTEPPSTAAQATATAAQITTDHGAGSYVRNTEPDNAGIAAIKAKTDNLPSAPAAVSDIPSAAATATATAAQITTDHGAGSYVRNTEPDNAGIAAIKAKTDNLPADPASTSALVAGLTTVLNAVGALHDLSPSEVLAQITAALTTAVADSVPVDGARPSIAQAAYMNAQFLLERKVTGTALTVFKPDGVTALMTLTLDSATAPTAISRAS